MKVLFICMAEFLFHRLFDVPVVSVSECFTSWTADQQYRLLNYTPQGMYLGQHSIIKH
jgi:hypothetical protein